VFVYLDALFQKKLFHPDAAKFETRSSLAAEEAVKTKRCLQALRHLWRNAKDNSHCPRVQHMKELLVESPQQQRNRDSLPLPDAEDSGTNDGCSEGDEPADVGVGVDHEDHEESSGSGDERDDSGGESESSEHEVHPTGRQIQQVVRVDSGASEENKGDHAGSSDDDSLVARTLRLSDCGSDGDHASESSDGESGEPNGDDHGKEETQAISSDDGIDWRDSQVSSSWLGRFYSQYGRFGKEESSDPNLPKCVEEGDQDAMLKHIRDSLNGCREHGE